MPFRKYTLLLPVLLLTTNCLASGHLGGLEGLETIFYIFIFILSLSLLSPILCFLSYRSESARLNVFAWIAAIFSVLATLPLAFTEYAMLLPVIPSICFALLFARSQKNSTGNRFINVYILKSVALLVLLNAVISGLPMAIGWNPFATLFSQYFLFFINAIILGILVSRLVRLRAVDDLNAPNMKQIICWSLAIGFGAYLADLVYVAIAMRSAIRIHINLSMSFFRLPFPNIIINLVCYTLTGVIVAFIERSRLKREDTIK